MLFLKVKVLLSKYFFINRPYFILFLSPAITCHKNMSLKFSGNPHEIQYAGSESRIQNSGSVKAQVLDVKARVWLTCLWVFGLEAQVFCY